LFQGQPLILYCCYLVQLDPNKEFLVCAAEVWSKPQNCHFFKLVEAEI